MAQRTLRDIINMPINNGETRGAKVDALHDYMLQNQIPTERFETDGELNWPSQARDQKQQINNMIELYVKIIISCLFIYEFYNIY